jgi:hypothetical protein
VARRDQTGIVLDVLLGGSDMIAAEMEQVVDLIVG